MKRLVIVLVCAMVGHDWRTPNKHKRYCYRCWKQQKRAFWDWEKWIND